jgi:hypothetical protein
MAGRLMKRVISRMPLVKRLPVFKLLAIAEVALLAREHYTRLTPPERRRLIELMRTAKGRTRNLQAAERQELAALVAKIEPRLFAGMVADKLSPVPLPRRLVQGPARKADQALSQH